MTEKKCKDCQKIKLLSTEFYKCLQNKTYIFYPPYCKECDKKRSRIRYQKNIAVNRLKRSEWQIKNMALHTKHVKAYERNHPERKKAWVAVRTIPMPDKCDKCGSRGQICKHHPDYSKPKDVKFLCLDCHKKEHRRAMWNTVQRAHNSSPTKNSINGNPLLMVLLIRVKIAGLYTWEIIIARIKIDTKNIIGIGCLHELSRIFRE